MPTRYQFSIKDATQALFVEALAAELNTGRTVATPGDPVVPTQVDCDKKIRELIREYIRAYQRKFFLENLSFPELPDVS